MPRVLPLIGFAGAVLLVISDAGTLFGLWDRVSPAVAIAVREFPLGAYLVVTGFSPAESHHVVMSGHAASS